MSLQRYKNSANTLLFSPAYLEITKNKVVAQVVYQRPKAIGKINTVNNKAAAPIPTAYQPI